MVFRFGAEWTGYEATLLTNDSKCRELELAGNKDRIENVIKIRMDASVLKITPSGRAPRRLTTLKSEHGAAK